MSRVFLSILWNVPFNTFKPMTAIKTLTDDLEYIDRHRTGDMSSARFDIEVVREVLAIASGRATVLHRENCDTILSPSDIVAGITSKPCNCGAVSSPTHPKPCPFCGAKPFISAGSGYIFCPNGYSIYADKEPDAPKGDSTVCGLMYGMKPDQWNHRVELP